MNIIAAIGSKADEKKTKKNKQFPALWDDWHSLESMSLVIELLNIPSRRWTKT